MVCLAYRTPTAYRAPVGGWRWLERRRIVHAIFIRMRTHAVFFFVCEKSHTKTLLGCKACTRRSGERPVGLAFLALAIGAAAAGRKSVGAARASGVCSAAVQICLACYCCAAFHSVLARGDRCGAMVA